MFKYSNRSILFIAGIIIVVLIIIGGGILVWQKDWIKGIKNNIFDWKTYKNDEYGFEIRYPNGAKISELETSPYGSDIFADNVEKLSIKNIPIQDIKNPSIKFIALNILANNNVSGSENFPETSCDMGPFSEPKEYNVNDLKFEERNIGGGIYRDTYFAYEYFVKKDNKCVSFSFIISLPSDQTPQESQIFKQIVSTFKFITPTNKIAEWKTYKNDEYGFEFKYPSNFTLNETNDVIANAISLSHSVNYKHANPCDFKGDAPPLQKLTDFNVGINIIDESIESVISSKDVNGLNVQKISLSGFNGYKYTVGVEYCGQDNYYLSVAPSKTLWIRSTIITELSPIIPKEEVDKYLAIPDIMNWDKSLELLNQIISTFKITNSVIQEPASDWKTYKNVEYGYEIKYPQDWIADYDLLSHMNGGEGSVVFCPPELQNNNVNGLTGKNGACIVDKTLGGSINPKAPIVLRQCDYHVEVTDCIQSSDKAKLFFSSNNPWQFNLLMINTKYQDVFNKILSTFKFITLDETTNWKTYKNNGWGIEFKYPSNFGNIKIDSATNLLSFVDPQNENKSNIFFLKKTTLADIAKCNQDCQQCQKDGTCQMCAPCMSSDYWNEEKSYIENNNVGPVQCFSDKFNTHHSQSCEIKQIGNLKMYIEHGAWTNGGIVDLRSFYHNETIFEFLPIGGFAGDFNFSKFGTDENTVLSTFKFVK